MRATRVRPASRHVTWAVPSRDTARRSPLVHAEIFNDALAVAGTNARTSTRATHTYVIRPTAKPTAKPPPCRRGNQPLDKHPSAVRANCFSGNSEGFGSLKGAMTPAL